MNEMNNKTNKNMIDFFLKNFPIIIGSGTVTSFFGWLVFGRKKNNAEYTAQVQEIYKDLSIDLKSDRDLLKQENKAIKEEHKKEVLYFRGQLDEVRKSTSTLQAQFNNMSMSYAKEVEVSQNWEKLHREVSAKYNKLQKYCESLEKSHEELKIDHEKLRKTVEAFQEKNL
jgi:chromosome segregation ATPase